jgi:hypothetical protein
MSLDNTGIRNGLQGCIICRRKRYTIIYVVNDCMLDHERLVAWTALTMDRSSRNGVLLTQSGVVKFVIVGFLMRLLKLQPPLHPSPTRNSEAQVPFVNT